MPEKDLSGFIVQAPAHVKKEKYEMMRDLVYAYDNLMTGDIELAEHHAGQARNWLIALMDVEPTPINTWHYDLYQGKIARLENAIRDAQ